MLSLVGIRSVYLTPNHKLPDTEIAGVVIGGGDDIEPIHYGAELFPNYQYDPERDAFEMAMIEQAIKNNLPILGICRGAQLINVVAGGNLHQDIRPLRKITSNKRHIWPAKWVDVHPESSLRHTLDTGRLKVNSLHSQAIDRTGAGLEVVARDRDGFVQAIEGDGGFLVGVQWHPEYLPYVESQRRLFNALTTAVRNSESRFILPNRVN